MNSFDEHHVLTRLPPVGYANDFRYFDRQTLVRGGFACIVRFPGCWIWTNEFEHLSVSILLG
jgi:hypothetical protein